MLIQLVMEQGYFVVRMVKDDDEEGTTLKYLTSH